MKHLTDSWIYENGRQRTVRAVGRLIGAAEHEAMRLPKRWAALKMHVSRIATNLRGGR
jgi:hypothetical protein